MSSAKRSRSWSVVSLIVSAVIVGFSLWVFANRQYVADVLNVWSYHPPASVMAVEQRSQLTQKGEFVFYAAKPSILAADDFNKECPRQEVGNPILGCYTGEHRIYLYDITDTNLDGIKEVTAVHEMLHAAWARSSKADQQRIGTLLQQVYESLDNVKLKSRMDYYQRTEPGEFLNELHSILGTEITTVGSELEAYYAQYFDRSAVLALHENYNGFYNDLTTQANELYEKMKTLATSIDTQSTVYTTDVKQLTDDITSFNTRAHNGDFSSQAQFNRERAALVGRSQQLDRNRAAVNADITTYNEQYSQYQRLIGQLQLLNQSMDSYNTLKEAPSV